MFSVVNRFASLNLESIERFHPSGICDIFSILTELFTEYLDERFELRLIDSLFSIYYIDEWD